MLRVIKAYSDDVLNSLVDYYLTWPHLNLRLATVWREVSNSYSRELADRVVDRLDEILEDRKEGTVEATEEVKEEEVEASEGVVEKNEEVEASENIEAAEGLEKHYTVEVSFGGYIGSEVEYEVDAVDDHDAISQALDSAEDELDVVDLVESDEGEWEATVQFAGLIGVENTYTVYADSEDDAIVAALDEAAEDLDSEIVEESDDEDLEEAEEQ